MECAVRSDLPSYAGGLGVLAGDTIRAAADHGVPLIGARWLTTTATSSSVLPSTAGNWRPRRLAYLRRL